MKLLGEARVIQQMIGVLQPKEIFVEREVRAELLDVRNVDGFRLGDKQGDLSLVSKPMQLGEVPTKY